MSLINLGVQASTYNGDLVDCVGENPNKENGFTKLCLVTPSCNFKFGKNKKKIVRYYSPSGASEFGNSKGNMIKKVFTEKDLDFAKSLLV